jgi:hypothetical protein
MNIAAMGITAGMAAQTAQTRLNEIERVQHDATVQERVTESAQEAEQAEGIGVTHEEAAAGERDADGRLPWQFSEHAQAPSDDATTSTEHAEQPSEITHHAKDPHGVSGTHLDLDG